MSQLIKVAGWTNELRASVVFVHGLGGHAYDTWRRGSDDQSFWPLWLAQDIEGVAVYSLNYPAPLSNWLGTAMPLQDRAVSVLECMLGEPSFRTNPITFICHSLGGLIVKQLMVDLQQQQGRRPQAAELLEQVRQVIFIATPHTGSRQGEFVLAQADELNSQGDAFGDNSALTEAFAVYRNGLSLAPPLQRPLDWAMTQNNLGTALSILGARESGTARLTEAVAAYREALQEYTRERVPLQWAATQNNLGAALKTLGERESDTAHFGLVRLGRLGHDVPWVKA